MCPTVRSGPYGEHGVTVVPHTDVVAAIKVVVIGETGLR